MQRVGYRRQTGGLCASLSVGAWSIFFVFFTCPSFPNGYLSFLSFRFNPRWKHSSRVRGRRPTINSWRPCRSPSSASSAMNGYGCVHVCACVCVCLCCECAMWQNHMTAPHSLFLSTSASLFPFSLACWPCCRKWTCCSRPSRALAFSSAQTKLLPRKRKRRTQQSKKRLPQLVEGAVMSSSSLAQQTSRLHRPHHLHHHHRHHQTQMAMQLPLLPLLLLLPLHRRHHHQREDRRPCLRAHSFASPVRVAVGNAHCLPHWCMLSFVRPFLLTLVFPVTLCSLAIVLMPSHPAAFFEFWSPVC